jgi:hypothetical protein
MMGRDPDMRLRAQWMSNKKEQSMHPTSETDLRKLASECLHKEGANAWPIYRDEAAARYRRDDDGPRDHYLADATDIFLNFAKNTKGQLRRSIAAGHIPMPRPLGGQRRRPPPTTRATHHLRGVN